MLPTYLLLTLAILGLWTGRTSTSAPLRHAFWAVPFLLALGSALTTGIVEPIAIIWIATFAGAVHLFARKTLPRGPRTIAAFVLIALAAGLMSHQLPGFNNPRVLDGVRFTADALPFRLHLNFDKTIVGLFLLAWLHARVTRAADWRTMALRAAPVAAGTIVALLAVSLIAGYVRFAPKLPPETALFLWVNLCFTCVAEEALFRGFIQRQLAARWLHVRHGSWLALGLAAALFGFAHAAGGPAYVALSTLAGVGYGWAYLRSGGRIEASILTHFAVNAVHFIGFTYPALQHPTG